MGLNRVLLGVMPFMAIICLVGVNTLIEFAKNQKIQWVVAAILGLATFTFPVWDNPSAVHWKRDMNLSGEQEVAKQAAEFAQRIQEKGKRAIYLPPYLSVVLHLDHFDLKSRADLHPNTIENVQSGDILIWDNWFSQTDGHFSKENIEKIGTFQKLKTIKGWQEDREIVYIVYKAK
jgi:hypothetical protein